MGASSCAWFWASGFRGLRRGRFSSVAGDQGYSILVFGAARRRSWAGGAVAAAGYFEDGSVAVGWGFWFAERIASLLRAAGSYIVSYHVYRGAHNLDHWGRDFVSSMKRASRSDTCAEPSGVGSEPGRASGDAAIVHCAAAFFVFSGGGAGDGDQLNQFVAAAILRMVCGPAADAVAGYGRAADCGDEHGVVGNRSELCVADRGGVDQRDWTGGVSSRRGAADPSSFGQAARSRNELVFGRRKSRIRDRTGDHDSRSGLGGTERKFVSGDPDGDVRGPSVLGTAAAEASPCSHARGGGLHSQRPL